MRTRSGGTIDGEPAKPVRNEAAPVLSIQSTGGRVIVTWGKEVYRPFEYNSIELGPYQREETVQEWESVQEVVGRVLAELAAVADREFDGKVEAFLARVKRLDAAITREAVKR